MTEPSVYSNTRVRCCVVDVYLGLAGTWGALSALSATDRFYSKQIMLLSRSMSIDCYFKHIV